jgi:hypothetical protein
MTIKLRAVSIIFNCKHHRHRHNTNLSAFLFCFLIFSIFLVGTLFFSPPISFFLLTPRPDLHNCAFRKHCPNKVTSLQPNVCCVYTFRWPHLTWHILLSSSCWLPVCAVTATFAAQLSCLEQTTFTNWHFYQVLSFYKLNTSHFSVILIFLKKNWLLTNAGG